MKSIITHGDNRTCPSVTIEGATHCPGHEVDVPEHTEEYARKAINEAYGRGFRRCFETMRKVPAYYVLFGAGEYDTVRRALRDRIFHEFGAEAASGFDSIE